MKNITIEIPENIDLAGLVNFAFNNNCRLALKKDGSGYIFLKHEKGETKDSEQQPKIHPILQRALQPFLPQFLRHGGVAEEAMLFERNRG